MRTSTALLSTSLLLAIASPAGAQSFSNTIFFGDSSSDSGRYLYLPSVSGLAPPGAGAYTTNPDPEWSVVLGQKFGITVTPSDAPNGGNNYAAGGALVATTNGNAWSATDQVNAYLASTGGHADPNALYVMWIGVNDLKSGSSLINNPSGIAGLAQQTTNLVASLRAAGAQYIVVPNLYANSSGVGLFQNGAGIVNSRALYAQDVWNGIAAAGINFIPADITTLYNYVLTNPAQFGITNIIAPACVSPTNAYQCTPANYATPNANQTYFFADGPSAPDGGGHLTGAGQQIEADYIYSLIVAPSQMSFLAEAPVKTQSILINTIQNQLPISNGNRGAAGYNAWVSGDVSSLTMNNSSTGFPGDPGTPAALTAGFDFKSNGWLYGAAFSVNYTQQSFTLVSGGFTQNGGSVSLYAAYLDQPLWFDVIGSFGLLHDSINRQVPLGVSIQNNNGTTNGNDTSLAGELGYNFLNGALKHGPVTGVAAQQVYVDGFTETGSITSLSFGSQTRNSAISEVGYQAAYDYGLYQPFAKLVWNHELADTNRDVTASLTTVAAPSYSMPAVILGKDWGTASIGTSVKISQNVKGFASLMGEFAQDSSTVYGGQIGVNVGF
jgi:outer membrane lipase/esterase